MKLASKVLKASSLSGMGQLISYGASFLRNVILARALTKADFGIAAGLLLMMSAFELSGKLSIGQQVIQAKDGDHEDFQATAQGCQFLAGCTGAVLIAAFGVPMAAPFQGAPGRLGLRLDERAGCFQRAATPGRDALHAVPALREASGGGCHPGCDNGPGVLSGGALAERLPGGGRSADAARPVAPGGEPFDCRRGCIVWTFNCGAVAVTTCSSCDVFSGFAFQNHVRTISIFSNSKALAGAPGRLDHDSSLLKLDRPQKLSTSMRFTFTRSAGAATLAGAPAASAWEEVAGAAVACCNRRQQKARRSWHAALSLLRASSSS